MYTLASAFIFGYIVMDNLDGKHARATGQTSKIGNMLDHGVDGLVMVPTGNASNSVKQAVQYAQKSEGPYRALSWEHPIVGPGESLWLHAVGHIVGTPY